jgi:hypothetical protein
MEWVNVKELKETEYKEMHDVAVRSRFADLDTEMEIKNAWEMFRENIKISAKESVGYYELKKHKPWFDKGYSELLDQRKHFSG